MARAAWALSNCRTRALGGHVNSCPEGHFHQIAYNSCRHRCCPQCGWLPREQWLHGWNSRLLNCPHHHLIFTLPHEFNDIWRYNKAEFANILFEAVSKTLLELLADPKYLGARPGILTALHTWNQKLLPHIHLHVLVTAGGLTAQSQWKPALKSCLLPRKVVMIKFRGKFNAILSQKVTKGLIRLPPTLSPAAFKVLLRKQAQSLWNVKIYDAYRDGKSVVLYLARYIKGGPIGNSRLQSVDNDVVSFRYRLGHNEGGDGKTQGISRMPIFTFIGRWLNHVPPKRFQTVRGYGLYGGNQHSRWNDAAKQLGMETQTRESDDLRTWQEWCESKGMTNVTRCPKCGNVLESHHEFAPGRGPPREAFSYNKQFKESKVA